MGCIALGSHEPDKTAWTKRQAGSPQGRIRHGGRLRATVSAMPQLSVRCRDRGRGVHNSAAACLLGHGAADAAQPSGGTGRSFRQLRAVQASHLKGAGTSGRDAVVPRPFLSLHQKFNISWSIFHKVDPQQRLPCISNFPFHYVSPKVSCSDISYHPPDHVNFISYYLGSWMKSMHMSTFCSVEPSVFILPQIGWQV